MIAYHLVPAEVWAAIPTDVPYVTDSLADEGFIHCTAGVDELVKTANRYYAADPRPFVVLAVDLDLVRAPWRFDAPGERYPHVYGPLERSAITGVTGMHRDRTGRFLGFEPPGRLGA